MKRTHRIAFAIVAVHATIVLNLHGQVFFERDDVMVASGWRKGPAIVHDITPQRTYRNAGWRAKMLRQFPDADADGDGALSEREAISYHLTHTRRFTPQGGELAYLPATTSHWTAYVPMRDGAKLPAEIYLPGGAGPWPVVLIRTTRGRIDSALDYANELLALGYAAVGGDLTPEGDFINADVLGHLAPGAREMNREERAEFNARRTRRNAANDGADTISWIAQQPWSNGRIGMTGYSEASAQSKNALSANPPKLQLVVSAIGTLSQRFNTFGVVRGASVDWETGKYDPPGAGGWEPPGPAPDSNGALIADPVVPDVYYDDRDGWFDFATQGAIDEWVKMRPNGKSTLIMGVGGHGRVSSEARMPPDYGDADLLFPQINAFERLRDKEPRPARSRFYYFLMGDATDPSAPGNVWKQTDDWPVAHEDVSFYLQPDLSLTRAPSSAGGAHADYVHDPGRPVETLSGNRMPSSQYGPRDQRGLNSRDDVLFFSTPVLEQPLELTGESHAELHVSSDAPDTEFIVQLVDVYPDGYVWPIRDNGVVTRHRDGAAEPKPLEKGKVYKLTIPMASTALVLAPGHRLGVQVMSSMYPSRPVHPNTWDAIDSYANARKARQSIHLSPDHASRIVVPVIKPGASKDYAPDGTTP